MSPKICSSNDFNRAALNSACERMHCVRIRRTSLRITSQLSRGTQVLHTRPVSTHLELHNPDIPPTHLKRAAFLFAGPANEYGPLIGNSKDTVEPCVSPSRRDKTYIALMHAEDILGSASNWHSHVAVVTFLFPFATYLTAPIDIMEGRHPDWKKVSNTMTAAQGQ